jgi:hypothetical protein
MKITDVRATTVTVPLEAPLRHANGCRWGRFVRTVVEVETDEGIVGLGEMGGGESAEAAFRAMKSYLTGHDPHLGGDARTVGTARREFHPAALRTRARARTTHLQVATSRRVTADVPSDSYERLLASGRAVTRGNRARRAALVLRRLPRVGRAAAGGRREGAG